MKPFLVFALPRSRTAWLSVMLGCDHDTLTLTPSAPEIGVCDTGGYTMVDPNIFGVKIGIRRNFDDCYHSFSRKFSGFDLPEMRQTWRQLRAHFEMWCDEFSDAVFDYADLSEYSTCNHIHKMCLGSPLSKTRFEQLSRLNIQITESEWTKIRRYYARMVAGQSA